MAEIKIAAEARTEFGKGAARRIRRADNVPAVLYGHGSEPVHVTLPGHQLMMALKNSNALLTIDLGSEKHLAIPKQVQRDPLRGFIEHADLLIVKKGEKVTVDVRIHVVGEAVSGNLVVTENNTISVEAEATHIPEFFEVSVEDLEAGAQIHARDIVLPAGSTLAVDEDLLVINVTAAPTAEQIEAELAEAEAEAGIEHDATDAETAEAEAAEAAEAAEGDGDTEGEAAESDPDS
ncbi:MAG: 50S ribosomal protein L25/general stress protein Ctc [Candidatus Limnocylindrales bacterium]